LFLVLGDRAHLAAGVGIPLAFSSVGYFPPEEGVVDMRIVWGKKVLGAVAASFLMLSLAGAQQSEEGKRKIKTRTNPVMPELARRMNISGKVKIEVVVAPDGHVKSSRPIGGHPVLVQSCLDAVKDWKFENAPEETTQIIEFDFKGSGQ
jgi:TonB family protein